MTMIKFQMFFNFQCFNLKNVKKMKKKKEKRKNSNTSTQSTSTGIEKCKNVKMFVYPYPPSRTRVYRVILEYHEETTVLVYKSL